MPWSTSRYCILQIAASLKRGGRAFTGSGCLQVTVFPTMPTGFGREKVSVPGVTIFSLSGIATILGSRKGCILVLVGSTRGLPAETILGLPAFTGFPVTLREETRPVVIFVLLEPSLFT